MGQVLAVIAGIGWEPEIRGLLTVAVASAVLMGSVWLLLVTNTGTRLGSLIALAGFFGWMFLMGIIWWIYGIGYTGDSPTWVIEDTIEDPAGYQPGGIGDAFVGNVNDLPDTDCKPDDVFPPSATGYVFSAPAPGCTPRAIELLVGFPGEERETALQELLNPQLDENKAAALSETFTDRDDLFEALIDARFGEIESQVVGANEALSADDSRRLDDAQLAVAVKEAQDRLALRIDNRTLSELAALSPETIEWATDAGYLDLNGWNLQDTAQAGEATATADAFLREEGLFVDDNFVILDTFQQGGKSKRSGDGMWDRVSHTFKSSFTFKHPTNYTVVQAQQALDKPTLPGQAPPVPEADISEPVVSVIMIRDLGNLRLVPALVTIASLLVFLGLCAILHFRDLELRRRLSPSPA